VAPGKCALQDAHRGFLSVQKEYTINTMYLQDSGNVICSLHKNGPNRRHPMKKPIALWHEVLPSGTPVFGPFDAKEDAVAPQLKLPSYRFSQAARDFVPYSALPLSEADRTALRQKLAQRLESHPSS